MITKLTPKSRLMTDAIDTLKRSHDEQKNTLGLNTALLYRANRAWDNLEEYRKMRDRCLNYAYGKQWSDYVEVDGKKITEEEYIKMQGGIPFTNNLIRRFIRSILGAYRNQNSTVTAVARDRDEQALGETMSIMLEFVGKENGLKESNANQLEEFCNSGMIVAKHEYALKLKDKKIIDKVVNPQYIFFDGPMVDPNMEDITLIGELHDMTFEKLCASLAKTDEDYMRFKRIYSTKQGARDRNYWLNQGDVFDKHDINKLSFLQPYDLSMCRVIEVWTLEQRKSYWIHDWLKGDAGIVQAEDMKEMVFNVNEQRKEDNRMKDVDGLYLRDENGEIRLFMPEEDLPLIEYEEQWEEYWYRRLLSPFGDVLFESESPYDHGQHPYTIKCYPMVNGQIHSMVADIIDQQRIINHYLILNDFLVKASAKGVLIIDEDSIPDDSSLEEIAETYTRFNGVIKLKLKNGQKPPESLVNQKAPAIIGDMINLQKTFMDDITGIHGALQGKTAVSGTSGALYQQQAANASTNIIDLLERFNDFKHRSAMKDLFNVLQFCDEKMIIRIAGKRSLVTWNPETMRSANYDLAINDNIDTAAYRQIWNDFLMQLHQLGDIDITELLTVGQYEGGDELLQMVQARLQQQQALAQQQQMMAPSGGGQPVQTAAGEQQPTVVPGQMNTAGNY